MTSSRQPGAGGRPPRRLLIATAVAHLPRSPGGDRPGLVRARQEIIDLFTTRLGYTHVSSLGLDPDRGALLDQLERFATDPDRRPDDIVVVYLAGHGQLLGSSRRSHMFFPSDADLARPKQALPTAQIASVLLDDTKINHLLLLLDTCHAGQGTSDAVAAALESLRRDPDNDSAGVAFVASAQPAQPALAEAFPELLRAAVDSLATAGEKPEILSLGSLVAHMNASPRRPPTQSIEWHSAKMLGRVPPFFPNPRHHERPFEADLAIQQAAEWQSQAQRRETELARRMLVRAKASFGEEGGWWFAGRRHALTEITAWVHGADPLRPALVVTGGPGSGKTAVLGLIAVLTHTERHHSVPVHLLDLPERAIPRPGSVDVAVYAQALTNEDVLKGLTAAAQVSASTPGAFLDALSARDQPFTAIIDALDEAATPDTLLTHLLHPLIRYGNGRLRLLLGTRPHLLRHLKADTAVLDLDSPDFADRAALGAYAMRGLTDSHPRSPYATARPRLVSDVARAVADAAFPSFLVARITSGTLAAQDGTVDPGDPDWLRTLPKTADSAMAQDLNERLGADAERARHLLRPLAYAEGQGLPWEDIWAPLAARLAGRPYSDEDLLWLQRSTGRYVVEATESGHSAYRLYHQALSEHLRRDDDEPAAHRAYVEVLRRTLPRNALGRPDWARAHPYTLGYLSTHAARSGQLDALVADCEFLVHAEPTGLLPALDQLTTEPARRWAAVYRASAGDHRRTDPRIRRELLAVDAARFGDRDLARALSQGSAWRPAWATDSQITGAFKDHSSAVNGVACGEVEGRPVAVSAGTDGAVRVWDLVSGAQRWLLTGHQGAVNAVGCTMLGDTPVAVTGGDDYTVRVWNLLTGSTVAVLSGQAGAVNGLACTTVNRVPVAVVGGGDAAVRLWDLSTGDQIATLVGHTGAVNGVACTTVDGLPHAVSVGAEGAVRLWNLQDRVGTAVFHGHTSWVWAVSCADLAGTPVAVSGGGGDGHLCVWDLRERASRQVLSGDTGWVNGVACADLDGSPLAVVGGGDFTVRVRDLARGTQRAVLAGHAGAVNAVATTTVAGDPVAVTGGADGSVRAWDLRTGRPRLTMGRPEPVIRDDPPGPPAEASPATALSEPDRGVFSGHTGWLWSVAHTTVDGVPVAVTVGGDGEGAVRLWDLRTGLRREVLSGYTGAVNSVACTRVDGVPVAIVGGGGDHSLSVWDLSTSRRRPALRGHTDWIWAVDTAEVDGRPLAVTGDAAGTVRTWDLRTSEQLGSFVAHTGVVNGIACTTTGDRQVALTVGDDGAMRTWDLRTGEQLGSFVAHTGVVNGIACTTTGDRQVALTVGDDGAMRTWDVHTGERLGGLAGHTGVVNAVAARRLDGVPIAVTVGDDYTVRVWNLAAGIELLRWATPYPARAVTLTPGADIIIGTGHEVVAFELGSVAGVGLSR
ncbi:caspase family protein [Kitasatospora sp. NBC_01287]|uniref:caspase family protein n=1 Tax=Kitasatospora sp. NBC_01287 TaxID=2903573 RepID=UPI0022526A5D|nr:caspase family protein [Kitasatospora sp. NBC_01287]MCX4744614.1 caspase family protein [Kitasatospora sp. NBC_01287]